MINSQCAFRLGKLTLELCQIPSVTGNEKAICDWLEVWCQKQFGSLVRRISNSLVAGNLDDARPTVLLVGHHDTVPPHPDDGPARLESDRVIGRGASDMKSGVAVLMALVEDLDLDQLPYNIVVVLYEKEEGPYDENGLGPVLLAVPELKRASLAIVLESTSNEVQMGCMGSMHARLIFHGKSAHSARPWQGENAIHKAAPLLQKLAAHQRKRVEVGGLEFFEVMNITLAKGGSAANIVPDRFEVNVNFRFAPGRTIQEAELELQELAMGQAEIKIVDRSPAGKVCSDNPLLQKLVAIAKVSPTPKQAWTDVARLGVFGIDAVNYGPGLTSQAHQAGEYVLLKDLAYGYSTLRAFLESKS